MRTKIYAGIVLTSLLTACGGGGGGDVTATNTNQGYTGKRELAQLNGGNQQTFYQAMDFSLTDMVATTGFAARPDAPNSLNYSVTGQRYNLISSKLDEYLTQRGYQARAFSANESCTDGGSMNISGDLDDNLGTGTLTMTANQCKEGDLLITGTNKLNVNKVDFNLQKITDFTVSGTSSLTYKGETYTETGVQQFNSDPYAQRVNVVSNMVRKSGSQQFLENNLALTFDSLGIIITGQVCVNSEGCVNISTPTVWGYNGSTGQSILAGANNSKIRLRANGGQDLIDLDSNGDSQYETTTLSE